jgi:hypothetical protein
VTLRARVQPRASRDAIAGVRDGALIVRVTAAPVEGAANDAVVRLLGRALGVAPSAIRLLRGASGREKVLRLEGLDAATVEARLLAASGR